MAKQGGVLKIKGTLGELSFYDSVYGAIVRRKGGPSRQQIKKSESCVRIRESNEEFSYAAKAGKLLRSSIKNLLKHVKDPSLVWRVTSLMTRLKDCDTTSARGTRKVAIGLQNAAGKKLIKGFDFNSKALLSTVLVKKVGVNTNSKQIFINSVNPKKEIRYPKEATHVKFKGALLKIDFTSGKTELKVSTDVIMIVANNPANVLLQMAVPAQASGNDVYLLKVEFMQEINGAMYTLENGMHNCLGVVEVA